MAIRYCNLGEISHTRGDLNAAEASYRRALGIAEALGLKEGMAIQYGNLGLIYEQRVDMAQACAHWRRARDIWRQIGHAGEVARYEERMRDAGCPE